MDADKKEALLIQIRMELDHMHHKIRKREEREVRGLQELVSHREAEIGIKTLLLPISIYLFSLISFMLLLMFIYVYVYLFMCAYVHVFFVCLLSQYLIVHFNGVYPSLMVRVVSSVSIECAMSLSTKLI